MPTRNISIEKQMVDTFIKTRGKKPESSQDWADVMKMAYPTNELPDEIKNSEAASLYSAGFQKPAPVPAPTVAQNIPQLNGGSDPNYLSSIVDQTNQAKTQSDTAFNAYDQMPSGNEALRVLQEAIKAKAAPRDFSQAGIGESEIFKQAGVGGFGALAQSLNARGSELEMNRADFANTISQMSDVYKTNAEAVQRRYEKSVDNYKFMAETLNRTMDQIRQDEQQFKLVKLQHELNKQLKEIDYRHDLDLNNTPTINDRLNALQAGYEIDSNGNLVAPEPTNVEADILADAIAQHESGGRFNAQGASGENGAFQFMPATWNIISREYAAANGIQNSIQMTQENENKVARWKIGKLLETNTPRQVALIWNGSLGGSEKPVVKSGTNSKGAKYDTDAYANSVVNILKRKVGASTAATAQASAIAQDIFSGVSTQKLSDVSEKNNLRSNVSKELTKLKQKALADGDIMGVIHASAGGKDVDATTATSFEKAVSVVHQIGDLKKNIKDEAVGPLMGIIRSNNAYDTKAQLIKAQLASIIPGLARGVYGEVGVLTDRDIENYAKTLPNLKSTQEISDAVLGMTIKSIQNSLETKIKVQAGLGRDVSGLGQIYQEVKKTSDDLLGSSSMNTKTANGVDLSQFDQ